MSASTTVRLMMLPAVSGSTGGRLTISVQAEPIGRIGLAVVGEVGDQLLAPGPPAMDDGHHRQLVTSAMTVVAASMATRNASVSWCGCSS